jgi:PAP_fibrillin
MAHWPLARCLSGCTNSALRIVLLLAAGELTMTYLDEEMRISRGDKGNLFVLLMDDPQDRP